MAKMKAIITAMMEAVKFGSLPVAESKKWSVFPFFSLLFLYLGAALFYKNFFYSNESIFFLFEKFCKWLSGIDIIASCIIIEPG